MDSLSKLLFDVQFQILLLLDAKDILAIGAVISIIRFPLYYLFTELSCISIDVQGSSKGRKPSPGVDGLSARSQ